MGTAEASEDARALPQRRGRARAIVSRAAEHADALGDGPAVGRRPSTLRLLFGDCFVLRPDDSHTEFQTLPEAYTLGNISLREMSIPGVFPFSVSRFPFARFPFPVSRFPFPVSRFPFPVSRFPFPVSRFQFPGRTVSRPLHRRAGEVLGGHILPRRQ